jgi:hypothetical protein
MSTCAARGCHEMIGPRHLMCFNHWMAVPDAIKRRIAHAPTMGEKRRAIIDAIKAVDHARA